MVAAVVGRRQGNEVRIFAFALIGWAVAATVVTLIGPDVDLLIAHLFYDPTMRSFSAYPALALLRDHGYVSIITCLGFVAAAVADRMRPHYAIRFSPFHRLAVSGRVAFFLASTLILGPGLVVNVALKDHWHRPRPAQVVQFGGDKPYVDWWDRNGTCDSNCSFAGGEASSAAWMTAPALLAPPPWRAAALGAAVLFTAAVSLSRMAVGGHFFTDVLFGALISVLIVWGTHALLFPASRPRGKD
jgi:membrane-associated phospholipid phosphatase